MVNGECINCLSGKLQTFYSLDQNCGKWNGVLVYTDFLPIGTRRTGQRLDSGKPRFAVFHDTGNRDSTAQQWD